MLFFRKLGINLSLNEAVNLVFVSILHCGKYLKRCTEDLPLVIDILRQSCNIILLYCSESHSLRVIGQKRC